jgi:hypothetical protein
VDIEFFHVKGHQDDDSKAALDRFALLNIRMDSSAKAHWTCGHEDEDFRFHEVIPGEGWPLWIGFEKITGEIRSAITDQVHCQPIEQFWVKRKRFPIGRASSIHIDWSATGHAMRSSSAGRRQWVTKQVSGWAPVGKWMLRRKEWTHDQCPWCGQEHEDTVHVLNCQDPRAQELWKKAIGDLNTWMKKQRTHPGIRAAITAYLLAWQGDQPHPTIRNQNSHGLARVIEKQTEVGWQTLVEGCPVQGWQEVQQHYFTFIKSHKTGKRWLSALICKLWQVAWDMWEHRNSILHDKEVGQAAEDRAVRLKEEFEEGCSLLDKDAQLLFRPGLSRIL